jgi:hypothetical protein
MAFFPIICDRLLWSSYKPHFLVDGAFGTFQQQHKGTPKNQLFRLKC